jgi:ABC-type bacteriocin/lantibiotic exporter with double-glycine peptidase domain
MTASESPVILPVPQIRQRKDGECLAACAFMVLGYGGTPPRYEEVLRLLNIRDIGTPHSNLRNLAALNLRVIVETGGTLSQLIAWLRQDHPCIVAVDTGELPY